MKIIKNNEGFYLLNDDNTPIEGIDILAVNIDISPMGVTAQLIVPVSEVEVNVPDTGVTKIKRKV